MACLASSPWPPVSLPWAELRAGLPPAIELPDPEGSTEDGEVLFKRIDRVTPNELQAHLQTRKNALQLEIQALQLLTALHQRAIAAGCDGHAPMFAAIERQSTPALTPTPQPQSPHSTQGAQ